MRNRLVRRDLELVELVPKALPALAAGEDGDALDEQSEYAQLHVRLDAPR